MNLKIGLFKPTRSVGQFKACWFKEESLMIIRATVVSSGPRFCLVNHAGLSHILFPNTCSWVGSQGEMPWLGAPKYTAVLPSVGEEVVVLTGRFEDGVGHPHLKAKKWSPVGPWDKAQEVIRTRNAIVYRVSAKERFRGKYTSGDLPGGFRTIQVGSLGEILKDNPLNNNGDPLQPRYRTSILVRERVQWERQEEGWISCEDPRPFRQQDHRRGGFNHRYQPTNGHDHDHGNGNGTTTSVVAR